MPQSVAFPGLLAVIVITVTAPALAQSSIGGAHKPAAVVGGPVASHNPVVPPQRGTAPPSVSGAIQ